MKESAFRYKSNYLHLSKSPFILFYFVMMFGCSSTDFFQFKDKTHTDISGNYLLQLFRDSPIEKGQISYHFTVKIPASIPLRESISDPKNIKRFIDINAGISDLSKSHIRLAEDNISFTLWYPDPFSLLTSKADISVAYHEEWNQEDWWQISITGSVGIAIITIFESMKTAAVWLFYFS